MFRRLCWPHLHSRRHTRMRRVGAQQPCRVPRGILEGLRPPHLRVVNSSHDYYPLSLCISHHHLSLCLSLCPGHSLFILPAKCALRSPPSAPPRAPLRQTDSSPHPALAVLFYCLVSRNASGLWRNQLHFTYSLTLHRTRTHLPPLSHCHAAVDRLAHALLYWVFHPLSS